MQKMYSHIFSVKGVFPFPTDMLRYDQCFPRTSDSAVDMVTTFDRRNSEAITIELIHYGIRDWKPTVGRWRSFGWEVIDHKGRR